MEDIFIFGASDHAKVVIDIVELEARYRIRGLLDSHVPKGRVIAGYEVLGTEHDLPSLTETTGVRQGIVGIGDNWTRKRVTDCLRKHVPDFRFGVAVHPSAYLSRDADPGPGTIIMGRVFIGIGTKIMEGCVLSSKASFEHDSTMHPFSSLGAGVTCGGHVNVGICSAICIGVTVAHKTSVGDYAVVGSGSTIVRNIPDGVVAYGAPARVVRQREPSERYL
jgi:sugar O-acyltransferase (sialic acid O-acetyltransferase NeuD family)